MTCRKSDRCTEGHGFDSRLLHTFTRTQRFISSARQGLKSFIMASHLGRVIRAKFKCTNVCQFEFRNKSFCVQLLSNCSSFSSLNFETSLFAYNYFLIAVFFPV